MRKFGWLDEFAEKYFSKETQYRDLNEKVHCHRQHKNGVTHSDGRREFDNLYRYCEEQSIEMPHPFILNESLTAIESQQLEEEQLNKYIAEGWKPLNKAAVGVNRGSLGASVK